MKPLLRGEKIRLTALIDSDYDTMQSWYQDADFMRMYDGTPAAPRTRQQLEKTLSEEINSPTAYYFAIRPLSDNRLIGITDISDILWTHGCGWLGIAIGEFSDRGKGYGTEAMRLMLDFGFRELNLHRIQLTVFEYNTVAIRLYESLGFTREGVHREFLQRDAQRYDLLLYGILKHEWLSASEADES